MFFSVYLPEQNTVKTFKVQSLVTFHFRMFSLYRDPHNLFILWQLLKSSPAEFESIQNQFPTLIPGNNQKPTHSHRQQPTVGHPVVSVYINHYRLLIWVKQYKVLKFIFLAQTHTPNHPIETTPSPHPNVSL